MKSLFIIPIIVFLLLSQCRPVAVEKEQKSLYIQKEKACCAKPSVSEAAKNEEISATPSDLSLYNLTSNWVSHRGDSLQLSQLKGKIQLVAMVYSSCQYACPRIIADLKNIKESLPEGEEVSFVLVSMDPERDTPEKLQAYAKKNNFDPRQWLLLTSKEENILELAAVLGVKYKKVNPTDYSHSNIITVLNKAGEMVHQQEGLGVDPAETVAAIQKLLGNTKATTGYHQKASF